MEKNNILFDIDEYMARFAPYIKRSEARELAQGYVVGLMMDGDRKSVEPMSKKIHAPERGMQRLLTEVKWNHEGGSLAGVWTSGRKNMSLASISIRLFFWNRRGCGQGQTLQEERP